MKEYERAFLEDALAHLSASMANALREGFDTETVLANQNQLSEQGKIWVEGYLLGHLGMIRGCSVGNPNVSADDVTDVEALIDEHEGKIAGEVYS